MTHQDDNKYQLTTHINPRRINVRFPIIKKKQLLLLFIKTKCLCAIRTFF